MNEQYVNVLARILRDILAAGSARNYKRMRDLAKELEELAWAGRDGDFDEKVGR